MFEKTNKIMKVLRGSLFAFLVLGFFYTSLAQQPLPELERELSQLAKDILLHDSLNVKIKLNKQFASLLMETLQRPESFDYAFDGLETISKLRAEDNSFRIFTWHIVDKNFKEYYGEQYHYFFGFVQRKYEANGQIEYIVIPLLEMPQIPRGVENMVLDNGNWLGALYYKPQDSEFIPSYTLKYYDKKQPQTGKKPKMSKQKFYLLLGWNGNDNKSNYKMVEVMSFDPEEKNRVIFGADVFYFDAIPKYRALFKYSEYAPFSLNFTWVQTGKFSKKRMIVYDHMGVPTGKDSQFKEVWDIGPDGSYDALYFYKRRGYFEWYRNVTLAEKYISKIHRKQTQEARENQKEVVRKREKGIENAISVLGLKDNSQGKQNNDSIDDAVINGVDGAVNTGSGVDRNSKKAQKQLLKEQKELKEREEKKLEEAGIKTKKKKDNP